MYIFFYELSLTVCVFHDVLLYIRFYLALINLSSYPWYQYNVQKYILVSVYIPIASMVNWFIVLLLLDISFVVIIRSWIHLHGLMRKWRHRWHAQRVRDHKIENTWNKRGKASSKHQLLDKLPQILVCWALQISCRFNFEFAIITWNCQLLLCIQ